MKPSSTKSDQPKRLALVAATILLSGTLSGCVMAGVTSGGHFFIWPGGLGLLVILLVVFLLMRLR